MPDIRDALVAIKDIAKLFAPLATVGESVDRLLALTAHEDELKQAIADKLAEVAHHDAAMATKLAETDAAIAQRQQVQANAEAGYTDRMAKLDADLRAAKDRAASGIADAENRVRVAATKAEQEIAALKMKLSEERGLLTREHDAFIIETKAHRAKIEENTAIMEATLREMREQAKAALGAVQEHAS